MRGAAVAAFVVVLGWLAGLPAWAQSATAAARAVEVEGKVLAISDDKVARRLATGQGVYATETVVTLGKAHVQLRFSDGSRYELGPGTRFRIDTYRFDGDPEVDFAATRVLKGFFRYLSGEIAKRRPRNTSIGLTVATIGIRGTHVVGEVTETSARVGLLEPEESGQKSAIEVSNAYGSVTIEQPGYATDIPDANSPPSAPRPMDLRTMTRNLRSMQTMRRAIAPRLPPRLP
ncbi:MAG: FecR domain-containing protein [Gammaproteobacteria bacterium]